ncbi:MAG: hypothetical protein WA843_03045 [Candidatus Saccharimonadales bacterium]
MAREPEEREAMFDASLPASTLILGLLVTIWTDEPLFALTGFVLAVIAVFL